MTRRYYSERSVDRDPVELAGDEARHLIRVMRAEVGQSVVVFDGSGAEFDGRIEDIRRDRVVLAVTGRREEDREPARQLTLGVALPKGDRQRWMIEKAVELGVRRIVPLRTQRGVAQPVPKAVERLRRAVVEASKQCGRNRLMEIAAAQDALDFFAAEPHAAGCWIAHPGGTSRASLLGELTETPRPWTMAIGPEGGWTEKEVQAAVHAGWQTVDLGPRILRVETAALLLAALATTAAESGKC